MIEFKNVTKIFDYQKMKMKALDDVTLTIKAGQIYGIIGKSGAGKSTLIRCINGLERPSFGEVFVFGKNIRQLSKPDLRSFRKRIGCVFQGYQLFSSYNVFENVAFPLKLAGLPDKLISQRVKELLEYVDLSDKSTSYPSTLSGGQRQRVAIARAISTNPHLLLCDEPTSSLDPITTRRVLNLLKKLRDDLGITIVMISHEVNTIKVICDDMVFLENGRIAEKEHYLSEINAIGGAI